MSVIAPSLSRLALAGVVLIASAGQMALQLTFGRLLAPLVGSTLAVWTCLIGAFLGGGALGYRLGGRLAESSTGTGRLRLALVAAGAWALMALGLLQAAGGDGMRLVPWSVRLVGLTLLVGLVPGLLLNLVVPLAVQLANADLRHSGRAAGWLSAAATLGSLAGTYATGFVLVPTFPVDQIVMGVAAALGVAALVPIPRSRAAQPSARLSAPLRVAAKREAPELSPAAAARVAFVAGLAALTLEIAACRLMAPLVGVSLYTWTGVIGVVLAGLAAGNAVGGWLADRWPKRGSLVACLLLAGLATLEILLLLAISTHSAVLEQMPLVHRILVWSFGLFFPPVLLFGTITPQVIRQSVADRADTGPIAGRIWARATLGALVGAFLTGTLLIPLLGVYRLVLLVALVPVVAAVVLGRLWKQPVALLTASLVLGAAVMGLSDSELVPQFTLETAYYSIRVEDGTHDGRAVKKLSLDRMVHSLVDLTDPSYLGYEHETVHAEIARLLADRGRPPRVLVIGGGGYTFPRWLETQMPAASVEVVEIDPGVTEVAHRELGLPRNTRIVSHHTDGRLFLAERGRNAPPYDLIVMDAVNDMSVPFHLLTKECDELARQNLVPEEGVYLMSVIDEFDSGRLLKPTARTLKTVFPEVRLLAARPAWSDGKPHEVFVLAASARPLDLSGRRLHALDRAALAAYLNDGPPLVLTDRYAPVDYLLAGVFRRRN